MPATGGAPPAAGVTWLRRLPVRTALVGGAEQAARVALAVVMTFPHPGRFGTHVPGDAGDALLLQWVLEWVVHAAPDGWSAIWNTNIFFPNPDTLAYSDSLLPLAPLFAVVKWVSGSRVVAYNVLALAGWTISLWATERLALRFTGRRAPAVLAAVVFTFSTIRLAQYRHLQLVWGCLVPVVVLALLAVLDRPSARRGAALGVALAAVTLIASYYGLMLVLATGMIVAGHLLWTRGAGWRSLVPALATGGIVAAALVGPAALKYLELQEDQHFRRAPEAQFAAHFSDFLAVPVDNRLAGDLWPLAGRAHGKTSENLLFPGVVALAAGITGLVALRRRWWEAAPGRGRELALLGIAGAVLLLLSFGPSLHVGDRTVALPYAAVRDVIPGLAGMRVPARFTVLPMLALALLGGVGVGAAVRRRSPAVAVGLPLLLAGVVLLESATRIETVHALPRPAAAAVNHELARRPPGVVVELPVLSEEAGVAWPMTEAPRMVAATVDWLPRVNGTSGFQPPGFTELAGRLNLFPGPDAMREVDRLGVRYVVLRTTIPVDIGDTRRSRYEREGGGVLGPVHVRRLLAALPRDRVRRIDRIGTSYLIELVPAPARPDPGPQRASAEVPRTSAAG